MKIVVMSDTHLSRVTDEFKAICELYCKDAGMVIHLGDYAKWPVLNFLQQYPLEAVAGNMDDHKIQNLFPTKKVVSIGKYRIGIIHGYGAPHGIRDRVAREFVNVDAILFGHTHQAMMAEENGIFWFNPGSLFMGRGSLPRSLGILYIEEPLRGEIISV
ncbi:MAG: metallophosphoesterase family protein [Syntrophobacteraceae bacterium]